MIERRRYPRINTNSVALIAFGNARQFESCRMVNLSLGGALVRTSRADHLPQYLSLYFDVPASRLEVQVAECSVVRRNKDEVAVEFTDKRSLAGLRLGF
jgi:hypothetical protein